MSGRVIDLAERSRTKVVMNGNGNGRHRPISARGVPTAPMIDVSLLALATQYHLVSDISATAEGRLHVIVRPDDSWEVSVERAGEGYNLLLRGTETSYAAKTLREIVSWLFGVPA